VSTDRLAATGIEPEEGISLILGVERECKQKSEAECLPSSVSESAERTLEYCVANALRAEKSDMRIIPAEEFRRVAFPGARFQDMPRTIKTLLPVLQDAGFRQRVIPLNLRYLVVVRVSTQKVNPETHLRVDEGVWGIEKNWERVSLAVAEVLDVKQARQSGGSTAESRGLEGIAFPFLLIVPLPPVPYSSPTETSACQSLGKAIGKFVLQKSLQSEYVHARDARVAAQAI
jgi:hypothetical protein